MPVTQRFFIFRASLGAAAVQAMGQLQRHSAEYLDIKCCFVTFIFSVCDPHGGL